MADAIPGQVIGQTQAAAACRCALCRDTGVVMSSCSRDCAGNPVPCACQDRRLFSEQEWGALRLELMVGLPIAAVAGLLLYLFH